MSTLKLFFFTTINFARLAGSAGAQENGPCDFLGTSRRIGSTWALPLTSHVPWFCFTPSPH